MATPVNSNSSKLHNLKIRVFGPPIPRELLRKERARFLAPTILMICAAAMLLGSIALPYWKMELQAPQYPKGLEMTVYVNKVQGDVNEVDGLNHYIGMRPISEAGQFERSMSLIAIAALVMLVVAAIFVHNPCALALTWPVMLYPVIFLLDLWLWMRAFGQDLDPRAPLSSIIEPFVPQIIGSGQVAQFKTEAIWMPGLYVAFVASVLIAAGIFLHRRAYKPLLDEMRSGTPNASGTEGAGS
jgi:copper chaperone NosL